MKNLFKIVLLLTVTSTAFAKVIMVKDQLFLKEDGKEVPLFLVNKMIEEKVITNIKLYDDGNVNLVSYAKTGESSKLYSIDSKGFVYAIEPYAKYEVKSVDKKGRIQFKEDPKHKYQVTAKGFFIH